jgi:cytidine deaminase
MRSRQPSTVSPVRIAKERLQRLRAAAQAAQSLHHAPYSGHLVLAAAELSTGTVRGGSNVEIVNLTLTKHAEEIAILSAFIAEAELLSSVKEAELFSSINVTAVYVAGGQPCGSCRQFAMEFASAKAIWVIEPITQEALRTIPLLEVPHETQPLVVRFDKWLPSPFFRDGP